MLSERLKELRKKHNITQVEFAKIFNVTIGAVGNWETDNRQPSYETLCKIAQYFNVTTDYLLNMEEEQKEKPIIYNDEREEKIKFINDYADTLNDEELEEFEKLIDSLQANQIDIRKVSKISRFVSDTESE